MAVLSLLIFSPSAAAQDKAPAFTCYVDADGDGYGDATQPVECPDGTCQCQPGLAANGLDCDDTDPSVHPGASEFCNGIDDDCNTIIDDNPVDATTWYLDADKDGYGDDAFFIITCNQPGGYVIVGGDCDDTDPSINPGAAEFCNGIDDDCNGTVDDNPTDGTVWYFDGDADGWGQPNSPILACSQPPNYVTNSGDCDDTDPSVHPGAEEFCNGIDDDCNGTIDDNASDATQWYLDIDGDGYGTATQIVVACDQPTGYAANSGDCDDNDPVIYPGAPELCDGLDNDCNTIIDDGAGTDWYPDNDNDGYGDAGSTPAVSCSQLAGYVADNTDCDDTNAGINPGAAEVCNGLDDDCDGMADNNPTDGTAWYLDADGDGFGQPNSPILACSQPSGYVTDNTDCDDSDPGIHPGATDIPDDGIDQDCDGSDATAVDCCATKGDVNCDNGVNVGDAVYLINFVFKGGPPPCCQQ